MPMSYMMGKQIQLMRTVHGEEYGLIIEAKGYDLIAEDDVSVGEDVESPIEVTFTLQRAR